MCEVRQAAWQRGVQLAAQPRCAVRYQAAKAGRLPAHPGSIKGAANVGVRNVQGLDAAGQLDVLHIAGEACVVAQDQNTQS